MPRQTVQLPPSRRAKLPPGQYSERKATRASFRGELDDSSRDMRKRVKEIAKKYKRSEPYVRSQMYGGSKSARFARRVLDVRLYDAYFHWKAKQMNEGLEVGQKHGLKEIREKISPERPNYKQRPAHEKAIWMAEYTADRAAAAREKRCNRRGEQQDTASTLKNVSNDLDTLNMRTGVRSVVFAVRSDILATNEPFVFCDNDFTNFFSTALGKTPDQIACMLEMWSIHGPSSLAGPPPKNASELKSEVRKLVQSKLDAVIAMRYEAEGVDPPRVTMNYKRYASEIVGEYGVRLVGWTITSVNPGDFPMHEARALYKGLIDQTVYWEVIPEEERTAPVPKRKHKVRSDKGGTHKKAVKTTGPSDAASSSRGKQSKAKQSTKPTAKSKGKHKAAEKDSEEESGSDSASGSGSDSD